MGKITRNGSSDELLNELGITKGAPKKTAGLQNGTADDLLGELNIQKKNDGGQPQSANGSGSSATPETGGSNTNNSSSTANVANPTPAGTIPPGTNPAVVTPAAPVQGSKQTPGAGAPPPADKKKVSAFDFIKNDYTYNKPIIDKAVTSPTGDPNFGGKVLPPMDNTVLTTLLDPHSGIDALNKYRAQRVKDLDQQLENRKKELDKAHPMEYTQVIGGSMFSTSSALESRKDEQGYNDALSATEKQINEQKNQLIEAVRTVAATKIVNDELKKQRVESPKLNTKDIGRRIRKAVGDPTVDKEESLERKGVPLDPSTSYYNDQAGYNAVGTALQEMVSHGADLTKNTRAKQLYDNMTDAKDKLLTDHKDFRKQQVTNLISDEIYKEKNWFQTMTGAYNITNADIQKAAKKLNIPEKYISDITDSDIHTANIFGTFVNELAVKPGGDIGAALGRPFRKYVLGQDPQVVDAYYDKIKQQYESALADAPNADAQFSNPTYIQADPAKDNYLEDVQSSKSGKFNWSPTAIANTVSGGIGQMSQYGLAATGAGAALKATKLVSDIDKARNIGLVGYGFLMSYDNSYQQARNVIGDDAGKEGARNAFAAVRALTSAYTELIFPDYKVTDRLFGVDSKAAGMLIDHIAKNGAAGLTANVVKKSVMAAVKEGVINTTKETAKEVLEEEADLLGDIVASAVANKSSLDQRNLPQEAIQTAVQMAISAAIPIGLGHMRGHKQTSSVNKAMLYDIGADPNTYISQIGQQVQSNGMSQEQADRKIKVVNTMSNIVKRDVPETSTVTGHPLSEKDKIDYAHNLLQRSLINEKLASVDDDVQKEQLEKQLEDLKNSRNDILQNADGVERDFNGNPIYERDREPSYKVNHQYVTRDVMANHLDNIGDEPYTDYYEINNDPKLQKLLDKKGKNVRQKLKEDANQYKDQRPNADSVEIDVHADDQHVVSFNYPATGLLGNNKNNFDKVKQDVKDGDLVSFSGEKKVKGEWKDFWEAGHYDEKQGGVVTNTGDVLSIDEIKSRAKDEGFKPYISIRRNREDFGWKPQDRPFPINKEQAGKEGERDKEKFVKKINGLDLYDYNGNHYRLYKENGQEYSRSESLDHLEEIAKNFNPKTQKRANSADAENASGNKGANVGESGNSNQGDHSQDQADEYKSRGFEQNDNGIWVHKGTHPVIKSLLNGILGKLYYANGGTHAGSIDKPDKGIAGSIGNFNFKTGQRKFLDLVYGKNKTDGDYAQTLIHEIGHNVFDGLTDDEKKVIEANEHRTQSAETHKTNRENGGIKNAASDAEESFSDYVAAYVAKNMYGVDSEDFKDIPVAILPIIERNVQIPGSKNSNSGSENKSSAVEASPEMRAIDLLKARKDSFSGVYQKMIEVDPQQMVKFIADQANDPNTHEQTVRDFGSEIVKAAQEHHPADSNDGTETLDQEKNRVLAEMGRVSGVVKNAAKYGVKINKENDAITDAAREQAKADIIRAIENKHTNSYNPSIRDDDFVKKFFSDHEKLDYEKSNETGRKEMIANKRSFLSKNKGGQNVVQQQGATEMGAHQTGNKGTRGSEEGSGVGQSQQGKETTGEGKTTEEEVTNPMDLLPEKQREKLKSVKSKQKPLEVKPAEKRETKFVPSEKYNEAIKSVFDTPSGSKEESDAMDAAAIIVRDELHATGDTNQITRKAKELMTIIGIAKNLGYTAKDISFNEYKWPKLNTAEIEEKLIYKHKSKNVLEGTYVIRFLNHPNGSYSATSSYHTNIGGHSSSPSIYDPAFKTKEEAEKYAIERIGDSKLNKKGENKREQEILTGMKAAVDKRLQELKEVKPVKINDASFRYDKKVDEVPEPAEEPEKPSSPLSPKAVLVGEMFANFFHDKKITGKTVVDEVSALPLTHVSGLNMGANQAKGTYISTEKSGNRYDKEGKAQKVTVTIQKPIKLSYNNIIEFRSALLNEHKDQFTAEDFEELKVPDRRLAMDDLNEDGTAKLSEMVTKYLQGEGFDSIYMPEKNDQEGQLIVFDRKNVKFADDNSNNKTSQDEKSKTNGLPQGGNGGEESSSNKEGQPEEGQGKKGVLAAAVAYVPLGKIQTDVKRFQPRGTDYSKASVDKIVNNYDENKLDPIRLFKDKDGKDYVLAGHSRFEAHRQLTAMDKNDPRRVKAEQKGFQPGKIKAEYFKGTEAEAIEFADRSNDLGTKNTDIESAASLRKLRERGDSKASITKRAEEDFGKNARYIIALSYLNQKGKLMNALSGFANSTDVDTASKFNKMGQWIGTVREQLGNVVTDQHENEMFDFLVWNDKAKKLTTMGQFQQIVNNVVGKFDYDSSKPLNLSRLQNKTQAEVVYDNEKDGLEEQIKAKQTEYDQINARLNNPNHPEYINPSDPDYKSILTVADARKAKINAELIAMRKELLDLKSNKATAINQGSGQIGMFDMGNLTPTEQTDLNTELEEDGINLNDINDYERDISDSTKASQQGNGDTKQASQNASGIQEAGNDQGRGSIKDQGSTGIQGSENTAGASASGNVTEGRIRKKDMVTFTLPKVGGRRNAAGTVDEILPDGKIGVRGQDGGYYKLSPEEIDKTILFHDRNNHDTVSLGKDGKYYVPGQHITSPDIQISEDEAIERYRQNKAWGTGKPAPQLSDSEKAQIRKDVLRQSANSEIDVKAVVNNVRDGELNADDGAIKLDEAGIEVTEDVYDKLRDAEKAFVKSKTGLQVGDDIEVKGKNGAADFSANFRGVTNDGRYVVVRKNGMQEVINKADVIDGKAPQTKPSTKPTVSEAEQAKIDAKNKALEDFKKAWNDQRGSLSMNVNPALLGAGIKLVGTYIDLGVYRFGEIAKEVMDVVGDRSQEFLDALKNVYGAYAATSDIDDLDDRKIVRSFTLDMIPNEDVSAAINEQAQATKDESEKTDPAISEADYLQNSINEAVEPEDKTYYENELSLLNNDPFKYWAGVYSTYASTDPESERASEALQKINELVDASMKSGKDAYTWEGDNAGTIYQVKNFDVKDGVELEDEAGGTINLPTQNFIEDMQPVAAPEINKPVIEAEKQLHPIAQGIIDEALAEPNEFRRNLQIQRRVFDLAGDANKRLRQEIMSSLKGRKELISKSGVTNIENEILKRIKDATGTTNNLESDSNGTAVRDNVGEGVLPNVRNAAIEAVDGDGGEVVSAGLQPQSSPGLLPFDATTEGERSNTELSGGERDAGTGTGAARSTDTGGGNEDDDSGVSDESDGPRDIADLISEGSESNFEDLLEKQRSAEDIPVIPLDRQNIAATLPLLKPGQLEDVYKAENRFINHADDESLMHGKGILFTNGTGTGKTLTGLGIAKRFIKQGRGQITIVVPSDKKAKDWIEEGEWMGIPIYQLKDTKDAPKGVVVTTYANLYANDKLQARENHLILYDESHKINSNEKGSTTSAENAHKLMSTSPTVARAKAKEAINYQKRWDALNQKEYSYDEKKQLEEELNRETRKQFDKTKVVFLSATPFAYHPSLTYADGYLFSISETLRPDRERNSYNNFYIQNFGMRMRYNKLTKPETGVDVDLLEMQFTENLKKKGVISSRKLDIPVDYSRQFIKIDDSIGNKIDEGLAKARDMKKYPNLYHAVNKRMNYLYTNQLMEALKARKAVDRIKKHLELGRKVVLFHTYIDNVPGHPFDFSDPFLLSGANDPKKLVKEIEQFHNENPEYRNLDLSGLRSPIQTIVNAFGREQVGLYNGREKKADRNQAIKDFNSDAGKVKIMVVQIDAGKEGISLHDKTGNYQRALMNLGLPVKPTDAIQSEGRIYRTGQKTNAVIEYPILNLAFERYAYASKIKDRVRTAENLAMGEEARNMETAFKEGYLNSVTDAPSAAQGTGGKEDDKRLDATNEFDKSKTYYYKRGKRTAAEKSQVSGDYFATPEPLGYKMVEWLNWKPNDKLLEPSAGHGAIARFMSPATDNIFIEPNDHLRSEVAVTANGETKAGTFEDLHAVNKFHGIAMNPPFGTAGKTAMEHLTKALGHLKNSGRTVALVPVGQFDKRFEAWQGSDASDDFYLRARILLPSVTFQRAATNVNTQILVIDRINANDVNERMRSTTIDLRSYDNMKDFFEAIRDLDVPDRVVVEPNPLYDNEGPASQSSPLSALTGARDAVISAGARNVMNQRDENDPTPVADDIATVSTKIHEKNGQTLHIVKLSRQVDKNDFVAASNQAKIFNGYYSKFGPGFVFSDDHNANEFASIINGKNISGDVPKMSIADRIRTFKLGKNTGLTFSMILPLPQFWNMAVEGVARAVEAGTSLADAMRTGYDWLKNNYKDEWKTDQYNKNMLNELKARGTLQYNLSATQQSEANKIINRLSKGANIIAEINRVRAVYDGAKAALTDPADLKDLEDSYNEFERYLFDNLAIGQIEKTQNVVDLGLGKQTWWQKQKENIQNRNQRLEQVQKKIEESGITIEERNDMANMADRWKSVAAAKIDDVLKEIGLRDVDVFLFKGRKKIDASLFDRMNKAGVDYRKFSLYMYALHAPERNRQNAKQRQEALDVKIADLSGELQDLKDQLTANPLSSTLKGLVTKKENELKLHDEYRSEYNNPKGNKNYVKILEAKIGKKMRLMNDGGSGMTDQQAAEILDEVQKDGSLPAFQAFRDEFRNKVIDKILENHLSYGLMSQEDHDFLSQVYQNYVPLKVEDEYFDKDVTFSDSKIPGAQIYRSKGANYITFENRVNPVTQAIIDLQAVIYEGEQNKYKKTISEAIKDAGDDKVWNDQSAQYVPVKDKKGRILQLREINQPKDGIPYMDNGQKKYLVIKDKALAKELTGENILAAIPVLTSINHYFRSIYTVYNPAFTVSNIFRDMEAAGLVLSSTQKADVAKNFAKNIPKALAIIRGSFKEQGGDTSGYWAQLARDYKDMGGNMTWFHQDTAADQVKDIEAYYEKYQKSGAFEAGKNLAVNISDYMNRVNQSVETATRLAMYDAMLKSGMDKHKAVEVARNATINFNKKGNWSNVTDSLYLFANAAVQGSANVFKTMLMTKKGRFLAGGLVMMGMMQSFGNGYVDSDCEKDPANCYDNIPDYEKERYMIIKSPGKGFVKIPLAYGFNVFWNMGEQIGQLMQGKVGALKASSNMVRMGLNAFNPVGSADQPLLQQLSPTATDPVVQWLTNRDGLGRKIYDDNQFGGKKPDSQRGFASDSESAKSLSDWLNKQTGGNDKIKGKMDVAPGTFDWMYETATGGLGQFIKQSVTTAAGAVDPAVDVDVKQMPIINRFYTIPQEKPDKGIIYDIKDKSQNELLEPYDINQFNQEVDKAVRLNKLAPDKAASYRNSVNKNQFELRNPARLSIIDKSKTTILDDSEIDEFNDTMQELVDDGKIPETWRRGYKAAITRNQNRLQKKMDGEDSKDDE